MANTPITIGYAGVIHPGAKGTPKIIGPDAIKVPEIKPNIYTLHYTINREDPL